MNFDLSQPIGGAANPNNLSKEELDSLKALEAQFGFGGGLTNNMLIKHFRVKHASISYTSDLLDILNIYSRGALLDAAKIYQLSVSEADMNFDKHNVVVPVSLYNSDDIIAIDHESMIRDNGVLISEEKAVLTLDINKVSADVNFFVSLGYSISPTTKKVLVSVGQIFVRKNATEFFCINLSAKQGVFTFSDDRPVVGVEKIQAKRYSVPKYTGNPGGGTYRGNGIGSNISGRETQYDDFDDFDRTDRFSSRNLLPQRPGLQLNLPPLRPLTKPPKVVKVKKVNATRQEKKVSVHSKAKPFDVNPFNSAAK